ncbi:hypothetical protein COY13_03985 [Candidatus Roizmanbacteria bacterium CG_4_10_14_0_2_um_filter_36_35]|uniref:Major facilitator superfamily (MFS) profile domain-containing protein n=4 Tax=Candidatus Roizmaniibacteriota TaxID=1752723 RepID=A0A2M7BVN7_9BACT|nr:MAG: hypothetical protein COV86_01870 [Candidatus Roizmanbacteria bacterium CG11_big_fil_rev_8_21_14_0_20_35_14]PIV10642.1 MAG: hypothetical protein COS50_04435 [Candidatus Roizmanbacteria bacterium CG03_land_8_20_14_0_80_35_26]PIZ67077.1 MAG: hypothetical protein COY13_03985 [Candidatus Roizmanbacteria bacterium CG_4_10_14_0_2_um_filter_36_35]PJC32389.1 MAG: hypothetical protein CO049_03150 [Candidatus Roizmanbacteria bacterium CG_4_9_14_0_2_um_filter_36_12]PJC80190.1 MAG: hypothetical prot
MHKLSSTQLNRVSEITGNISVAWFSGGIITPLIARSVSLIEFLFYFIVSLFMSGAFFVVSLEIIKKQKKYD